MVRALVATLPPEAVRTNVGGHARRRRAHGAVASASRSGGETPGGGAYECRALVLSTPAYVTAALVRDDDAELARLCAEIPYASIATVALAFPREAVAHPLNGSGFVVPRAEGSGILAAIVAVVEVAAPRAGRPRAAADVRRRRARSRRARAVGRRARRAVARRASGRCSGSRGEPLLTRVYRFERASAQHEVGHSSAWRRSIGC